ncbi:MAG: hypothetical protein EPO35_05810 [Acidobacteria bacterium]|nr:MAG: hypothetical protein EPO35_05810 [Acidobacteriota bacterium]
MGSKFLTGVGAVVMAAGAVLFAQGGDAAKVMADMRQALGGDKKLAAVKALTAVGKNDRVSGERTISGDFEMALELPEKFLTKQTLAQTPMGAVALTVGFNGAGLIQDTEAPQMPGGGVRMVFGGASPNATPEENKAAEARMITQQKQEFTRMALGLFGAGTSALPVEFTYGGVAESPDGKADIINVKGDGDFAGKLFVDQKSHLPLMFSWMAKEPVQMVQSAGRSGGGGQVMQFGRQGGAAPTPEERDKMMKDLQDQMKAAEANRKTVEFRVYYGNYQDVDGVKLPHSFQQSIAGAASSEITIEKYKVNPKIDPKRFEPKK